MYSIVPQWEAFMQNTKTKTDFYMWHTAERIHSEDNDPLHATANVCICIIYVLLHCVVVS